MTSVRGGLVNRRTVTFVAAALLGVITACLDDSITGTRPLSFDLTADVTTPTAGQDVTFSFAATGTLLRSVFIDFGDGAVDTTTYVGPVTVTGQAIHAFDSIGVFVVVGEAFGAAGSVTEEITITVN